MTRESSPDSSPRPPTDSRDGRRRSSLRDDDRGVSEILGAILLFAVVLMLVVMIQVSAVPGWNQQVEYEHNQRLQEDMQELTRAASEVARTGDAQSVLLELGARYPPRPFLFNPAPTVGTVDTGPPGDVTLTNADLVGVDNVWQGGNSPTYETRAIRYRPAYNEYDNAPVTVYETGLLYNDYEGTVLKRSDADLVEGKSLNLLTVTGSLDESGTTPENIEVSSLSGEVQTVPVQSESGSFVEVRVSTRLSEDTWRTLLEDELDGGAPGADNNPDAYIASLNVETGSPLNTLVLRLEPGPSGDRNVYDLRMAKLGVGDGQTQANAHYITNVTRGGTAGDGVQTRKLTVEVRNEYNNPVPGTQVTFNVTDGNGVFVNDGGSTDEGPITVTTDEDGRATVEYRSITDSTVVAGVDFDGSGTIDLPREQTTFSVARDTSGDNNGNATNPDDSGINPQGVLSPVLTSTSSTNKVSTFTLENRDTQSSRTINEVRINFYFDNNNNQDPTSATFLSESITISGGFVNLSSVTTSDRTIAPGASKTFTMTFDNTIGNGLYILTVIYDNGQVATYFIEV